MRRGWQPYVALVFAASCWGIATTVAKLAVRDLGPFSTLVIELFAASVVLWTIKLVRREWTPVPVAPLLGLALLEPVLAYGALNLGLMWTDASQAALLDGLQTVLVLALAYVFLRESPSRRAICCAAVATTGAVILVLSDVSLHAGIGSALVFLGALGASGSVLVVNRLSDRVSVLDTTAYPFLFGFVASLGMAALAWSAHTEHIPSARHWPEVAAAAGLGVLAFAMAYLAYNYAVSRVPVGVAGAGLSLIPLFGSITGVVVLDERWTLLTLVAGTLIILGVTLFPSDDEPEPERVNSPTIDSGLVGEEA